MVQLSWIDDQIATASVKVSNPFAWHNEDQSKHEAGTVHRPSDEVGGALERSSPVFKHQMSSNFVKEKKPHQVKTY